MANQVQCNRCGYIFDSEEEEFGYCPCCENDQMYIAYLEDECKVFEEAIRLAVNELIPDNYYKQKHSDNAKHERELAMQRFINQSRDNIYNKR